MLTLRLIAATTIFVAFTASAGAQDWPTRPVTMVVPFAAGGGGDVIGRILAARLSEVLGRPVVVENVSGAGGMIGACRVAKAAPDGYQFVLGSAGTHAYSQTLHKNPLCNSAADFAPVALIAEQPLLLLTRKDLPVGNLPEFIAYAKANQEKMKFGSGGGAGSANHIVCLLLNSAIGVDITHVPYRGLTPAMQDMISGRIDYQCPLLSNVIVPQIESNLVKAVAIFTKARSPILPSVASAHEQGLANFEANTWFAFFLPKGTPASIVQKLRDATVAAMDTPAVQERLTAIGTILVAPERRSPEYLQRFVVSEIEKWAGPIRASGVTMD